MATDVYHDAGISQRGFALILAMLMLVTLTLLGIIVTRTSVMENMIVSGERTHRETFTLADGGSQVGTTLLEENFVCPGGFQRQQPITIGATVVDPPAALTAPPPVINGLPLANGLIFWQQRGNLEALQISDDGGITQRPVEPRDIISDANRFVCIRGQGVNSPGDTSCLNPGPAVGNAALPHTNIFYNTGAAVATPGGTANMSGGASGMGYDQSQGGTMNFTNIASQHLGVQNSMSIVEVRWRHLIGLYSGNCIY